MFLHLNKGIYLECLKDLEQASLINKQLSIASLNAEKLILSRRSWIYEFPMRFCAFIIL